MLIITKILFVIVFCLFASGIPILMAISKFIDGFLFSYQRALQSALVNDTAKKADRDGLFVRLGFYYEICNFLLILVAIFDDEGPIYWRMTFLALALYYVIDILLMIGILNGIDSMKHLIKHYSPEAAKASAINYLEI